MLIITNWWGMFCCLVMPLTLWIIGIYCVGVENGKRQYRKNKYRGGRYSE